MDVQAVQEPGVAGGRIQGWEEEDASQLEDSIFHADIFQGFEIYYDCFKEGI